MTPEVYIDKEIMPLLLKVKCPLERVIKQDFKPVYYTKDSNDPTWQDCDAYYIPTQSQVMQWLRKVHNICIIIFPETTDDNGEAGCLWGYAISKRLTIQIQSSSTYMSYNDACESAINDCLTKLI